MHGARSRVVCAIHRFGHGIITNCRTPVLRQVLLASYRLLDICLLRILLHVELPAGCSVGRGFRLMHGGNGLVVHPLVRIGDNVVIYHQVTIGTRYEKPPAPTIGSNVLIGAGAKILGGIHIGDGAKIGANAVVLSDVPEGATA